MEIKLLLPFLVVLCVPVHQQNVVRIKRSHDACPAGPWAIPAKTVPGGSISTGAVDTCCTGTTGTHRAMIFQFIEVSTSTGVDQITSIVLGGTIVCNNSPIMAARSSKAGTQGFDAEVWVAGDCSRTTSSTNVTWNFTGGCVANRAIYEVTGLACLPVIDGSPSQTTGSSTTSTQPGPTVTTTVTGDFISSVLSPQVFSNICTGVQSGWTYGSAVNGCNANLTSNSATAGTYGPTWTMNTGGSFSWAAATVAFTPN